MTNGLFQKGFIISVRTAVLLGFGLAACSHPAKPENFSLQGGILTETTFASGFRGPAQQPVTGSLMLPESEDTVTFKYVKMACSGSAKPISFPDVFLIPIHCSNGEAGTASNVSYRCLHNALVKSVRISIDDGSLGFAGYETIGGSCALRANWERLRGGRVTYSVSPPCSRE